ncbi:MAG: right-handed parallel beta-helix repeat-containing protein, partial [Candidatus Thorarchaeota archaeon]|nr:right-handed parallel beta-helix repeat-containing protein [Candidatus Thorarchaeota archaeon]
MTRRILVAITFSLFILITASVFIVIPEYSPVQNIEYLKTPVVFHTSHEPVRIRSNVDFSNLDLYGDGTSGNPYLIEGLTIITESTSIYIIDTTVYFEIRNCTITNINQNSFSAGIIFVNVAHGTIRNCTIEKGYTGVGLDNSDYCSVINNTITENEHGVRLTDSTY